MGVMTRHEPQALPPLLSMAEVGLALGVSASTVRRLVDRGELAGVRVGYQVRIAVGEVEHFLAANRVGVDDRESGADEGTRLTRREPSTRALHATREEEPQDG
jgi:excisionase family DNA binding protein